MEVILLTKIDKLGKLGDQVTVRPGFGRNYLLPQQKALPATAVNIAKMQEHRAKLEQEAKEALVEAQKRAQALEQLTVTIAAQIGAEGKLFGSIGTQDIVNAIQKAGLTAAKSEIRLPDGPIRMSGEHAIVIQAHPDVRATIKVIVVAEA